MKPVSFPEQTTTYAAHQPQHQYIPLPAHVSDDAAAAVTSCWVLTWRERLRLLVTGRLWPTLVTFHHPLRPIHLSVIKPTLS